jgi:hypothetical protein
LAEAAKKYVVLISPTEKLSFMVQDTTIFYRRLPPSKRRDLLAEHSVRGTFDATSVIGLELAVAQYCIRGWENLLDAEGKQVPFLEEVISYLPVSIIQRVGDLALDTSPDELMARFQSFLPNSTPSSALVDSP